jgi:hypothetical protein
MLVQVGLGAPNRIQRFTGNYYRTLGWIGVSIAVTSVLAVNWTHYLNVDLSFIIWFWLGRCLKEGNPRARKWAIAIFVLVSVFSVLALFLPNGHANVGSLRFDGGDPIYYAIVGITWLIFAIPGIILLSNGGRAAFTKTEGGQDAARRTVIGFDVR